MFTSNNNHPLFTLTVSEFLELQKALLKDALTFKESNNVTPCNTSEYLNFSMSASYLGISKPTFSKLRREGMISAYRVSENRVLFAKRDLDNYIKSRKEL